MNTQNYIGQKKPKDWSDLRYVDERHCYKSGDVGAINQSQVKKTSRRIQDQGRITRSDYRLGIIYITMEGITVMGNLSQFKLLVSYIKFNFLVSLIIKDYCKHAMPF